jgi:phosphoribosylformylglycinamidine synthase
MKSGDIRVCILRIEGTNCEQELWHCYRRIGANPELVHLNQLLSQGIEKKKRRNLSDYHILMIPGGFSAGDYVRAGAIWAARMKSGLRKEITRFVEDGKAIGGICNGFQVLVELGLIPGFDTAISDIPQAVLGINDSSRFECRPTFLKMESRGKCAFTGCIAPGSVLNIPSAHAEGKFMLPMNRQGKLLERLVENDQVVFRYVDPDGKYAGYPWNPNGALFGIAGLCNEQGNVFGMMPHPERVFYRYQHPDWTRKGGDPSEPGDGRAVFESVISYIKGKF